MSKLKMVVVASALVVGASGAVSANAAGPAPDYEVLVVRHIPVLPPIELASAPELLNSLLGYVADANEVEMVGRALVLVDGDVN
ncbi:MAG: hypothetical protein H6978_05355 [Gammaproteobacteria bacterium]|nr:hypothetical protein [Gammaproteobacteria bacterium]